MLVKFFAFVTFTARSLSLLFSPTIIPSYTSTPGSINIIPRSSNAPNPYAVDLPFSIDTNTPSFLSPMFPSVNGPYSLNVWFIIPYPLVSIKNSFTNPINPREGTRYSNLVLLSTAFIFTIVPFLLAKLSITDPIVSVGASIRTSSYGSYFLPSISLIITSGFDTCNSNPSLLIFSISIDK